MVALAAGHLVVVAWLTLLQLPIGPEAVAEARAAATYDHNPVPLATIAFQLAGGLTGFELRQSIGNLLLLLPFGILAPMVWPGLRSFRSFIVAAAGVSTAIELGQLLIATAYGFPVRVADVDDVLLNTLGAALGFVAGRRLAGRMGHAEDRLRRPAGRG